MKRKFIIAACCLAGLALLFPALYLTSCYSHGEETAYVYIADTATQASVKQSLAEAGVRTCGFSLLSKVVEYRVRAGRYAVKSGDNLLTVFRRLRNGQQEPVNLTIPPVRTLPQLAAYLGKHLMMDSATVARAWADGYATNSHRYSKQTLPVLFVPNTYQVYWNVSIDDLMNRMQREHDAFWTEEREAKAKAMGFTHEQVATLASIVDEETANNAEKPMIAGMYIKRLSVGMPLQADPTVKFALGDFALRRIYQKHLTVDSPYNTYRQAGLPPGPIRIASIVGIDAVLNYVHHDFLFMCAKEDFSGTHNFAHTYQEHLQNARKYTQALNERKIK